MKRKMTQSHQQVPQVEPDETGDIQVTYVSDDHQDPSTLQSSYHSYLSADGELHDDDVLKAFSSNLDTGEVDLHLDHAITIAVATTAWGTPLPHHVCRRRRNHACRTFCRYPGYFCRYKPEDSSYWYQKFLICSFLTPRRDTRNYHS